MYELIPGRWTVIKQDPLAYINGVQADFDTANSMYWANDRRCTWIGAEIVAWSAYRKKLVTFRVPYPDGRQFLGEMEQPKSIRVSADQSVRRLDAGWSLDGIRPYLRTHNKMDLLGLVDSYLPASEGATVYYPCFYCKRKFASRLTRQRHMVKNHGIETEIINVDDVFYRGFAGAEAAQAVHDYGKVMIYPVHLDAVGKYVDTLGQVAVAASLGIKEVEIVEILPGG